MAKRRTMQTTEYDGPGTLVFCCRRSLQNSDKVNPKGDAN